MTDILAHSRILGRAPDNHKVHCSTSLESASLERNVLYYLPTFGCGKSASLPNFCSPASPAPCPLSSSGSVSLETSCGSAEEETAGEEARVRQRRTVGPFPQAELPGGSADCVVAADCDFSPSSSPRHPATTSLSPHTFSVVQTRHSLHAPSFVTDVSTSFTDSSRCHSVQEGPSVGSGRRCPPSSSSAVVADSGGETSRATTGVVGCCERLLPGNPAAHSSCCSCEAGPLQYPIVDGSSMDAQPRQQLEGAFQTAAPQLTSSNSVTANSLMSVEMSSTLRQTRKDNSEAKLLVEEASGVPNSSKSSHRRSPMPSKLASFFFSGLSVCGFLCGCLYGFRWLCSYLVAKMSAELLLAVLDILCPLTSLLLYASPIAAVVKAVLDKEDKCLPVRIFVVQGVANILAIDYGVKTKHQPIYLTNLTGLLIQLVWLGAFNYIRLSNRALSKRSDRGEPNDGCLSGTASSRFRGGGVLHRFTIINGKEALRGRFWQHLWAQLWKGQDGTGWLSFVACCVSSICGLLYISSFFSVEAVGMGCTVSTVMLVTVPLTGLGNMIRTKTSSSLPLATVSMMVLCNGAWGMYGSALNDPVLYVPSLIGFLLSLFLLLVVLWCRNLPLGWVDFAVLFPFLFAASSSRQMTSEQQQQQASRHHQHSAWTFSEDYYDSLSPSHLQGCCRSINAGKFAV